MNPGTYHALADLVLIVHVLYVAFVVFGLVLIWCGGFRGWSWVRTWRRLAAWWRRFDSLHPFH